MICVNCGAKVEDGAQLCLQCGTPIEENPTFAEFEATIAPSPATPYPSESYPTESYPAVPQAVAPQPVAPQAVAPQAVAPQVVAPQAAAPYTVAPGSEQSFGAQPAIFSEAPAPDFGGVTTPPLGGSLTPQMDATPPTPVGNLSMGGAPMHAMPPQDATQYSQYSQYPQPVMAAPVAQKKKSKKGIFIIVGAVVLVVILAVGAFFGFNIIRSNNYDKAVEMYNSGSYQEAQDAFGKLGNYKDSSDYSKLCDQNILLNQAIADYERGLSDQALATFNTLANENFSGAQVWIDKLEGEKKIRGYITEALSQFNDPQSYMWQTEMQATLYELEAMGINAQELVSAWIEGFQFEVGAVTVTGNYGTAEVTITCKQFYPAIMNALDEIMNDPNLGDLTEEEVIARLSDLTIAQLRNATPVPTRVAIPYTKSGNDWVEDYGAEEEIARALLGEGY